ncbi:MAG: aminotransferase class V-fold PLP-dependent enzyme [Candidatus Dormibacteraeota bacterium]|nr:aminotransferase class V-fold PLP-dependent enzyme [Candidatus Dormibacteraeota bacterium]
MPLSPAEMRDLFPIARRYAYLDHAAIAPLAVPVRSAMTVFLDRMTEDPFELAHWQRLRSQVRARIGELLSVGPERIAFTKNTTTGLGLAAAGLDWRDGDNIVGVDREFPANIYPWMGLKTRGVELRLHRPPNGRIDVKALVGLCDARTRMVAISAVQFWSGYRADLAALRDGLEPDVLLVVDAIQATGALKIDLSAVDVDLLCAGAQKWLLGPTGIGFACVSARMLERMRPVTIGTDSVVHEREYFTYDLTFKPDARRYEEAAPNYPGILGFGAAVNLLLRAGPAQVEATVLRLADRLRDELPRRGYALVFTPKPRERSGIVSFRHPRIVPAEVQTRLRDAGIILSLRADFLRASPHFYNSDDDLNRLLDALPA